MRTILTASLVAYAAGFTSRMSQHRGTVVLTRRAAPVLSTPVDEADMGTVVAESEQVKDQVEGIVVDTENQPMTSTGEKEAAGEETSPAAMEASAFDAEAVSEEPKPDGLRVKTAEISDSAFQVVPPKAEKEPNDVEILREQIKELRDGLVTFQKAAYRSAYGKDISWKVGEKENMQDLPAGVPDRSKMPPSPKMVISGASALKPKEAEQAPNKKEAMTRTPTPKSSDTSIVEAKVLDAPADEVAVKVDSDEKVMTEARVNPIKKRSPPPATTTAATSTTSTIASSASNDVQGVPKSKAAPKAPTMPMVNAAVKDVFKAGQLNQVVVPATKAGGMKASALEAPVVVIEDVLSEEMTGRPIKDVEMVAEDAEGPAVTTQRDVLKAQQAITESFLALGGALTEANMEALLEASDVPSSSSSSSSSSSVEAAPVSEKATPSATSTAPVAAPFGGFNPFKAKPQKTGSRVMTSSSSPSFSSTGEATPPSSPPAAVSASIPKAQGKAISKPKKTAAPFGGFSFGGPSLKLRSPPPTQDDVAWVADDNTPMPPPEPTSGGPQGTTEAQKEKEKEEKQGGGKEAQKEKEKEEKQGGGKGLGLSFSFSGGRVFKMPAAPAKQSEEINAAAKEEGITEARVAATVPVAAPTPLEKASTRPSAKPLFSFGARKAPASKAKAPPAPAATPTAKVRAPKQQIPTEKTDKEISDGLFRGLFGKRELIKPRVPSVTMDKGYQKMISALLDGNKARIRSFQTATDAFRAGDKSDVEFLEYISGAFGDGNMDQIVPPLVQKIPEVESAKALSDTYKRLYSKKSTQGRKGGNIFAGLFTRKDQDKAATIAAPVSAPKATKKGRGRGGGTDGITKNKATTPVGGLKTLPSSKKAFVNGKVRSFRAGRLDATQLYNSFVSELGQERAAIVASDVAATLPADLGTKLLKVIR